MTIVKYLSEKTGTEIQELNKLISQAPRMYKVYKIPKRSLGFRVIAQPAKSIKKLQRFAVEILETILPVHESAMAYQKDKDIKKNALLHVKNNYILKMDFEDFFNSINPELFIKSLKKDKILISKIDLNHLTKLLFWNPSKRKNGKLILSVGAPSSPLISNYIMYRFDCDIEEYCQLKNITYSRYADDMTFSTKEKDRLFEIPGFVKKTLKKQSYKKISIKQSKTIFSSKAHNRHVTGVTLNNQGNLSIGRARKRMLSSFIYKACKNELNQEELLSLVGQLGQAFYIDKIFKKSMERKYGLLTIKSILGGNNEKI
ncbi:retron St85 family RNA-directed DNA polymerase [Providencia rettgeri]|uniref:retron St85 family RNA-directed DNA polymerase n=1 Tax=Providencia rettgeri TaxID=587 RepID=UPI000BD43121|nr:retron St85 family RNA-directed DNA polymerase [Providencia rettgeri]PCQ39641.1 RNA-dependent DNA polymerase [Providencia rettgeri]BBU96747.1 RNA-directed DNA polymerase [Providencia rettgeri]